MSVMLQHAQRLVTCHAGGFYDVKTICLVVLSVTCRSAIIAVNGFQRFLLTDFEIQRVKAC
jgi:hypothetical protein